MKRSSSQGFYKFDNDESFHGSGSVSKENGSALKEKYETKATTLNHKFCLHFQRETTPEKNSLLPQYMNSISKLTTFN